MSTYEPAAMPLSIVDPSGAIADDLPCRKCAYNLRTLPLTGRCPECGTPVEFSAQGDLLRFSDPAWLGTLHRGVVLLLSGIAVMIIGGIVAALLTAALPGLGQVMNALTGLAGYGLMVAGSWLMTEPDPSGLGEDRYGTARKLIRITLLVGVSHYVVELMASGFTFPPAARIVAQGIAVIGGIASVIGVFAFLQYIGKLALRIPNERIVSRARFLKWALAITYSLLVVGGFAFALAMPGAGPPAGTAFAAGACVMGVVFLALIVFGIMYLFMLDRLRKALKEQAQTAALTWTDPAQPTATV